MIGNGKGFRFFANFVLILLTLSTVLPFILLLVSSITSEEGIMRYGYSFIPWDIDFAAYRYGVVCRVLLSYLIGVTLQLGFYGFVLGYSLATFANGIPSMWAFLRGDWGSRQAVI